MLQGRLVNRRQRRDDRYGGYRFGKDDASFGIGYKVYFHHGFVVFMRKVTNQRCFSDLTCACDAKRTASRRFFPREHFLQSLAFKKGR